MVVPTVVFINKDDYPLRSGRTLGVIFQEYNVSTDSFEKRSITIEPQDLPFLEKYYTVSELKHYMERTDAA